MTLFLSGKAALRGRLVDVIDKNKTESISRLRLCCMSDSNLALATRLYAVSHSPAEQLYELLISQDFQAFVFLRRLGGLMFPILTY